MRQGSWWRHESTRIEVNRRRGGLSTECVRRKPGRILQHCNFEMRDCLWEWRCARGGMTKPGEGNAMYQSSKGFWKLVSRWRQASRLPTSEATKAHERSGGRIRIGKLHGWWYFTFMRPYWRHQNIAMASREWASSLETVGLGQFRQEAPRLPMLVFLR